MVSNESNFEIKTYSITKKFGKLAAVDNVNLSIKKGELFSILGPNDPGSYSIEKKDGYRRMEIKKIRRKKQWSNQLLEYIQMYK